jgi:hypothetical protein
MINGTTNTTNNIATIYTTIANMVILTKVVKKMYEKNSITTKDIPVATSDNKLPISIKVIKYPRYINAFLGNFRFSSVVNNNISPKTINIADIITTFWKYIILSYWLNIFNICGFEVHFSWINDKAKEKAKNKYATVNKTIEDVIEKEANFACNPLVPI